jgi:tetratricopeptide (TPR) repeat protein
MSFYHLGQIHNEQRENEEALPLFKRALSIQEKTPNHHDHHMTLKNIATAYYHLRQYEKAYLFFERAFDAMTEGVKPDSDFHYEYPYNSFTRLGNFYYQQGLYNLAERAYKRTLKVAEKKHGLEHPDVAKSLDKIALAYEWQKKYEQSRALYDQAYSIRKKILKPDHPDIGTSLKVIAYRHLVKKEYDQAIALLKKR